MGSDYFDSQEFLENFNSKNDEALRQFYNQYWQTLYAYARRLTQDPEEARDQAQDAFVKLYSRDSQPWHSAANILSFLYTTVRNGCSNYLRNQERSSKHAAIHASLYLPIISDQDEIENAIMEGKMMDAIFEYLPSLPETHQLVLKLLIEDGKPYREVATILNITENQVKHHRSGAFKKLRELVTSHDTPGVVAGSCIFILIMFFRR